ncbi:hypothetical protein BCY86_01050 [Pajaroellobacter abortibovis]|uniref:Uncharacterized protein n=2 Tax=Pajaroellobacter abortibovis TaxID=1882918 RepID=A0A1L6MV81_9BACT|nr:hypothetical protein BCY86_01050 [Pajaroellobacter abortibovis]
MDDKALKFVNSIHQSIGSMVSNKQTNQFLALFREKVNFATVVGEKFKAQLDKKEITEGQKNTIVDLITQLVAKKWESRLQKINKYQLETTVEKPTSETVCWVNVTATPSHPAKINNDTFHLRYKLTSHNNQSFTITDIEVEKTSIPRTNAQNALTVYKKGGYKVMEATLKKAIEKQERNSSGVQLLYKEMIHQKHLETPSMRKEKVAVYQKKTLRTIDSSRNAWYLE